MARNPLFAALCILAVAGLGGARAAHAGEVVLYSSNSVEAINTVVDEFNKKYPDIKVSPVRGSTGAMMQRIKAEAANPKADIFWSGGFPALGVYREYFAPYRSAEASAAAANFRGPDDLWLGTNAHVMVIMVNKRALKGDAMPRTWSDLADPKWKDRLVIGDPEKTSSSYATLWGIDETLGREPLKGIARNATAVSTASQVYEGVAKGEFAVGFTMEYAAQEYVAGGQKDIQIVYPSEGTFIAPEGMALVKGAKNPQEAKKFFDFLASKSTEELLARKFFRRPVREDIDTTPMGLPRTREFKVRPLDDAKATAAQPAFLVMWKELAASSR
jgi:iron(III) transport system substrate-binding protein